MKKLIVLFLFLLISTVCRAQTATPTPGGVCAGTITTDSIAVTATSDNSNGGNQVWLNPSFAFDGCNGSNAGGASDPAGTTDYLKGTNFGFVGIPNDAVILGIGVMTTHSTNGGTAADVEMRLVKADGTLSAGNRAGGAWVIGGQWYGGSTDDWDETWTGADINDTDFGLVMSASYVGATAAPSVDCFTISVCWDDPPPTPTPTPICTQNSDCHTNCCGDCNDDGIITSAEVDLCNEIREGDEDLSECPQCDCDDDTTVSDIEFDVIIVNAVGCCAENGVCLDNECVTATPAPTNTPVAPPTAGGGIEQFQSTLAPTPTPTPTQLTPTPTNTVPSDQLPVEAELESVGTGDAILEIQPRP